LSILYCFFCEYTPCEHGDPWFQIAESRISISSKTGIELTARTQDDDPKSVILEKKYIWYSEKTLKSSNQRFKWRVPEEEKINKK
jgi:hypothetical protein